MRKIHEDILHFYSIKFIHYIYFNSKMVNKFKTINVYGQLDMAVHNNGRKLPQRSSKDTFEPRYP